MATDFTHTQHFPVPPEVLMNLLTTEEFIIAKCEATGSLSAEARVDGALPGPIALISIRVLPADLPAPAKSLVGETITVTETQNWSAADSTGNRTATVRVEFSGPMKFEGRLQLESEGENGSRITTTGKFTANVPFIGGKIEKVAAEQTSRYLNAEEKVAREQLG
jgi:hypothetical protein